ncbi:MAG: NADH-quinone oxidoreductase subunit N [Planctomycetota bacterium]
MLPSYAPISLWALLPEIILLAGGCAVLLLGQATREGLRRSTPGWVLGTIFLAIIVMVARAWNQSALPAGGSGLAYGTLAIFARNSALVFGVVVTLVAWMQPRANERGEFWSMLLFSLAGVLLVGAATDLLMLFLALELVSIPTYIMVVLSRRNIRALEAGTKYFYLGAMSAALMAYGFCLLYGVAGTASLAEDTTGRGVIAAVSAALNQPGTLKYALAAAGVVLSLGGLMFKIAAVPLHFYIADVYQGAASSVAGFLGFVPKFAGFLAILKIMVATGHWIGNHETVFWMLWIVATLSMCVGNMLALMQSNIKRMLAYSGIAHSGYMLVGVLIGPYAGDGLMGDGAAALLYYVVVYGIANLGAFAVLGLLRTPGGQPCETLRDIAGLLRRHPGLALLMALAMFTLMGLPPSAGFWGKLSLFGGALASVAADASGERWLLVLVIIGVLNSALAAAYYLRVIAAVLLYENEKPAEAVQHESQHIGAVLCGFLLLVFAFYPSVLLQPSRQATAGLRGECLYEPSTMLSHAPPLESRVIEEAAFVEPAPPPE